MRESQAQAERGSWLHVPGSLSQDEQEGVLEEGTLQLQPGEKDTRAAAETSWVAEAAGH